MDGFNLRAVSLGLVFLAATIGANGCNSASCDEGSRTYQDGQYWTCADGCNRCGCRDGTIESSMMSCASPPGPAAGMLMCWEGNFMHTHGETWVCADGCDECTCSDGHLATTSKACTTDGGGDGG